MIASGNTRVEDTKCLFGFAFFSKNNLYTLIQHVALEFLPFVRYADSLAVPRPNKNCDSCSDETIRITSTRF
jgi:hypothetical protein